MKNKTIRLGIAGALAALSLAGLAVPAHASLTADPCGPVVDSVKFCTAENGAGYALLVDTAAAGPRPGISGALQVGSTVTVVDGTWDPADATFTHQWLRNDVPVLGATGPTYLLTEADLGKGIRVKTTATASGYAKTTLQSTKTVPVTNAGAAVPSIQASGVSFQLVGEGTSLDDPSRLVIAMPGSFSGAPVIYFQYQWLRDGEPIPGATAKMFDTTGWGSTGLLSVRITGHAPGFTPATRTSLPRGVSEFNPTPGTVVTGNTGLGDVLTAVDEIPWQGFTGPGEPIGHTYTWLRDGVLIPGATGMTRSITAEDQGHTLVVETHSTRRWSYGTSYSNAIAVPAAAGTGVELKPLRNVTKPVLTGSFMTGTPMTVTAGAWSEPAERLTFTYDWMLPDGRMWDAGPSYAPGRFQLNQIVSVFVTVSAPGYAPTRIKVTAPKPLSMHDPDQTKAPAISGTATVRETLTVNAGVWTRYDMRVVKESRQWLRDGAPIAGATGSDYTLVGADYGKKISARVTSTIEGKILTTQTVNTPAKVAAAALVAATPTIAGTVMAGNVLTVKRGTWTWGVAFTYRWLRNGVTISGATEPTYKVRTADKGTKLTVSVTGSRLGYTTVSRTSAARIAS
ncbi:hypothetical protein [Arthrobacter sp. H-02-3]|uniref:hypothetical protein n=1 Tax=Arthrobacter sp. H-02-3 TaxID=2703675 RepID=UPI000DD1A8A4|nr:hypothetical protein [Arthrobacter sp. H-02-3]PVZ52603.1 hypothetical protein C9424_19875 [Arthrobacter sp. H-02-3]